ncbi:MAG: DivIVA domain-containing protein [Actinomycetes bacterium]
MSATFETAPKHELGYEQVQVDALISAARAQFADEKKSLITATQLRKTEFDLVRGGYALAAVDAAIDRLDDALASIEIAAVLRHHGRDVVDKVKADATALLFGRIERPAGKRFSGTGWLLRGYSKKQVDVLVDLIDLHLTSGARLNIDQVRRVIFKSKRRGYNEAQVDAFIDKTIELLQLEKNS